jgi:hypothetical protein
MKPQNAEQFFVTELKRRRGQTEYAACSFLKVTFKILAGPCIFVFKVMHLVNDNEREKRPVPNEGTSGEPVHEVGKTWTIFI